MDDDPDMVALVAATLAAPQVQCVSAGSAEQALAELGDEPERFDLLLADVGLPGMSGLELCRHVFSEAPTLPVVMITASERVSTAVEALRSGARDYLRKPLNLDELKLRVGRVLQGQRDARELERLRTVVNADGDVFEGLVGESAAMLRVYELVRQAAKTDASVLVTGESGTGKELVARALHARSQRSEAPFVPVNCSAIPENLLESELFGHAKGAFTDAGKARGGLFLQAHTGTLFLDEFGEIPPVMQVKLLRALEERRIRPVGADVERPVNIRLLAATNRDLEAAIEEGSFREDLFFRVNVIHIPLPPLRSRGADVLLLAHRFLTRFGTQFGKATEGLSPSASERLMSYDWPGNVRELRNCMERAVALATGGRIEAEDFPDKIRAHRGASMEVNATDPEELATLAEVEQRYVRHVMAAVSDNKSMAARILGLDRKTLHRRLQRYIGDS